MAEMWYYFQSGPGAPALNMALDEALLEAVCGLGRPVLRFYGWAEPAATFGYSQRFADVQSWTELRPLLRRPTGGGLVPHDADWTYSLAFPPGHGWYRAKASESYQLAHQWISRAFSILGVQTVLSSVEQKPAPGRCFLGAEKMDLLWNGAKLAGAAQRRNQLGLLIQGSVQPRGAPWSRTDWERAMLEGPFLSETVHWERMVPSEQFNRRAIQLAEIKYSRPEYNQRR